MSTTTSVTHDTSTVHDIRIVMPDDTLAKIEMFDMVRVIFVGRGRETTPKTLSYSDLRRLLDTP